MPGCRRPPVDALLTDTRSFMSCRDRFNTAGKDSCGHGRCFLGIIIMTCPSQSRLLRSTSALGRAAFTLSEILIALAVLGTMSAGAYIGFNAVNAYSVSSRLYSEAQAICQNQIDMILSKGPFDLRTNRVPAVLTLGTTTTPNVFVYRDPVTGNVVVTGTM